MHWQNVEGFAPTNDPGPPPKFEPEEYVPYRKTGTATLRGKVIVKFVGGGTAFCAGRAGEEVLAYPNTAYTRWAIAKWLHNLNGHRRDYADLYPGDYGDSRIPMPAYLVPLASDETVIRSAKCSSDGGFEFTDLPGGSYIIVAEADIIGALSTTGSPTVGTMLTPYGLQSTYEPGQVIDGIQHGQGWVLINPGVVLVKPGRAYEIDEGGLRPAATYSQ